MNCNASGSWTIEFPAEELTQLFGVSQAPFYLSFGSGPCGQHPCSCPSPAVQGSGRRSLRSAVSQRLISTITPQPPTDAWPSCIWQIGIAFDSSCNNIQGLMWFVFAALIFKISLITQNPSIQTDLFKRTGAVFEEYSTCCLVRGHVWSAVYTLSSWVWDIHEPTCRRESSKRPWRWLKN